MRAPFAVRDVVQRRRGLGERLTRWAWGGFGLGSLLFGSGMLWAALLGPDTMPLPVALGILTGTVAIYAWPVVLALGLFLGRRRRLRATRLRLAGTDLVVEGETGATTISGPFRQGAVVRDGAVIEDARGDELHVAMDGEAAAELIDALDLEPERRRFTFRWQNTSARVWSWITGFFVFGFLASVPIGLAGGRPELVGLATSCSILMAPFFITELASRFWARRELTVGLDGIEHRSRRGNKLLRFVDVTTVRSEHDELVVRLRDGTEHRLLADPADPAERSAIEARVREAMAVARAKAGTHSVAGALLERAGRSMAEWRDAAAQVLTAATGFRDAHVAPDELGAVIDDTTATAEQRVAAAIALAGRPEHRPRVRLAADTAAQPALRVALERIAEGTVDDEALSAAIDEEQALLAARSERAS